MIRKFSGKQPSQLTLNGEQLQKLVTELTEQNQETISGGGEGQVGRIDMRDIPHSIIYGR